MHQAAHDYVARWAFDGYPYPDSAQRSEIVVLEFGSQETNWGVRDIFDGTNYTGVDAQDGKRVDVVADATQYRHPTPADIVVCAEVAEHYPYWPLLIENAWLNLRDGGRFIFTAAGPGRAEHGVNADDPLHPGWYRNIEPHELCLAMMVAGDGGFRDIVVECNQTACDVYATGVK